MSTSRQKARKRVRRNATPSNSTVNSENAPSISITSSSPTNNQPWLPSNPLLGTDTFVFSATSSAPPSLNASPLKEGSPFAALGFSNGPVAPGVSGWSASNKLFEATSTTTTFLTANHDIYSSATGAIPVPFMKASTTSTTLPLEISPTNTGAITSTTTANGSPKKIASRRSNHRANTSASVLNAARGLCDHTFNNITASLRSNLDAPSTEKSDEVLAPSNQCNCKSCKERDQRLQINDVANKVKRSLRELNPERQHSTNQLRDQADWLSERDPGALYNALEEVGRQQVQEAHGRLLQLLKDNGVSTRDHCRKFVHAMVKEFNQVRETAQLQARVIRSLEDAHLAEMDLSWKLLCEHWFHSLVYTCEEIQAIQPVLLDKLKPQLDDDESPSCMKIYLDFDTWMSEISEKWRKAQQHLEDWQERYCNKMLSEDIQFFQRERQKLMQQYHPPRADPSLEQEEASLMKQLYRLHVNQRGNHGSAGNQSQSYNCVRCRQTLCACSVCSFSHYVTCGMRAPSLSCSSDSQDDEMDDVDDDDFDGQRSPSPGLDNSQETCNCSKCAGGGSQTSTLPLSQASTQPLYSSHNHPTDCDNSGSESGGSETCQHRSASATTGRFCDCCYCEVFGHGGGQQPPVSNRFYEKREQLRDKLKKKKKGGSTNTNVEVTSTPTVSVVGPVEKTDQQSKDDRSLQELLTFIQGSESASVEDNRPKNKKLLKKEAKKEAKKQRQKAKKLEKKREQEFVIDNDNESRDSFIHTLDNKDERQKSPSPTNSSSTTSTSNNEPIEDTKKSIDSSLSQQSLSSSNSVTISTNNKTPNGILQNSNDQMKHSQSYKPPSLMQDLPKKQPSTNTQQQQSAPSNRDRNQRRSNNTNSVSTVSGCTSTKPYQTEQGSKPPPLLNIQITPNFQINNNNSGFVNHKGVNINNSGNVSMSTNLNNYRFKPAPTGTAVSSHRATHLRSGDVADRSQTFLKHVTQQPTHNCEDPRQKSQPQITGHQHHHPQQHPHHGQRHHSRPHSAEESSFTSPVTAATHEMDPVVENGAGEDYDPIVEQFKTFVEASEAPVKREKVKLQIDVGSLKNNKAK